MAFGRFSQWIEETVGSVFENEDENKQNVSDEEEKSNTTQEKMQNNDKKKNYK